MDTGTRFTPEPTSAPGDFYVENQCCTACGIPQHVAPDLVGWVNDDDKERTHCRWKKQPTTEDELERAFKVFDVQELGCHRYSGSDPVIQLRVGVENCDYAMSSSGQQRTTFVQRKSARLKLRLAVWSKNWRRKQRV